MTQVVAFRLINGAEIVGKLDEHNKTHNEFIDSENDYVLYLADAVLIGVKQADSGNASLMLAPLSGIGQNVDGKNHMPFALYRTNIMGQIPLDPEINRAYREATSGIALLR